MDTAVALKGGLVQGARTSVTPACPKTAALPLTPERLVESYADTILRVSYTYLHNYADAEDICQEVLLKALAQEQPFRSEDHERAWVIRVAINLCKDQLRRAASRQQVASKTCPSPPPNPHRRRTRPTPPSRACSTRSWPCRKTCALPSTCTTTRATPCEPSPRSQAPARPRSQSDSRAPEPSSEKR